jgi:hypothetical protein
MINFYSELLKYIKIMSQENSDARNTPARLRMLEEKPYETSINQRRVKAKEIARKLKSFDHFVYVWGEKGHYYIPPKSVLTWHYISQILAQEKRLLKLEEVGHMLEVPKVRGSVVNDMFDRVKDDNGLHFYFPDFTESQNVPRDYFFNVRIIRY